MHDQPHIELDHLLATLHSLRDTPCPLHRLRDTPCPLRRPHPERFAS